ncbi:MAG: ParB/RepB/Spo0J family partition protein [Clostridia bacterium]|nr:ParB/RepB/Spo0J family partition protein [Clostridia bacterium]
MAKKPVLGTGLSSLTAMFGESAADDFLDGTGTVNPQELSIELIDNDATQPRKQFDDEKLDELAKSIRTHGIMQPLLVCRTPDGRYRIIAGERRFRAARLAGLTKLPVVIRDAPEAKDALEMALIENIQREDLNPMEQAGALRRLVKEYGMRQEEVAERVGKSRSAVANLMRLLHLPDEIQEMVAEGRLSAGHARALLPLENEAAMLSAASWVLRDDLSVRQTEDLVRSLQAEEKAEEPETAAAKKKKTLPPEFRAAQERLSSLYDTQVKIVGSQEKGKITIAYFSKEQLDALYNALGGADAD